ncbi:hypothetical protein Tco_1409657 [Tanacetum coccineum]
MSFSKRQGNDDVCYSKPLDSLKSWNDRFFWVDAFACPASFPRNTSKSASKYPFPKSSQYNPEHYATLVAYPAPFYKYPKPFLCLIGISHNYTLDEDTYPKFLRDNNEEMDLLSFIQIANPTKVRIGESELKASVDKLFDEGGIGSHAEQGDSVSGGHGVGVPKKKMVVSDAGEPSHPPKKLREDHETSTEPSVAGFSKAKVDFFASHSLLLMTMTTTVTSTVDPTTTAKKKFVESFIFDGGSSFGVEHTVGGFSGLTGSDFIIGGIRTVVSPDTDLQKVYVPQWSVTNGSCLDDGRTCREMMDEFAPPKFFASIRGMEHDELFTEFNVGAARQISLSAEVRMYAEFNIREKRRLSAVVEEKNSLLKARDEEVASLKAQLLVKEAEAAKAVHLRAEVQALANRNTVLKGEKSELDVKVADLEATVKVREQEVADLDDVVTSVKVQNDNLSDQVHTLEVSSAGFQEKVTAYENFIGQLEKRDFTLLTHGLELAISKCLNSTEYLSSLGAAIGKAVEKGMQEGLSVGITHGAAGRVLTDVVAYNPSAEADYLFALQRLQSVNFSLITELKSNKDASIDTIMNLLRLEDSLVERLALTESQPRVDQLMVPIHHSPDQRVIGASALSLSLDVSSTEVISATIDTPTTPSTTLAFVSTITPISIEDYEVAGTDGQEAVNESVLNDATGGNVNPFTNVDDVELNVSQ